MGRVLPAAATGLPSPPLVSTMGSQESGSPESLRADLRRFAQLVLRLEQEGKLLDTTPQLLKILGDLRAKLFAFEIRSTEGLQANVEQRTEPDPAMAESERIVREAIERGREAMREWQQGWDPASEDE